MGGDDGLGHGGHTDRVGAEHARGADLGGRFKLRAGEIHIDTLAQRNVVRRCRFMGEGAQTRGVDGGHIGKAGAELLKVGAAEGTEVEELDVIGEEHQLTHVPVGVDAAGGVGDEERLCAEQAHDAYGVSRLGHGVALVAVHPALHDRDAPAAERAEHEAPLMTGGGGGTEMGNLAVIDENRVFHGVAKEAEPAAEDQQRLGREAVEAGAEKIRAFAVA